MCMPTCLHACLRKCTTSGESKQDHLQPCHHLSFHFLLQNGGLGACGAEYGEVLTQDYNGRNTTVATSTAILYVFSGSFFLVFSKPFYALAWCLFISCHVYAYLHADLFSRAKRGQISKQIWGPKKPMLKYPSSHSGMDHHYFGYHLSRATKLHECQPPITWRLLVFLLQISPYMSILLSLCIAKLWKVLSRFHQYKLNKHACHSHICNHL